MKEIKRIYGGYFNSANKIANKKMSSPRISDYFEIEFFDSDYFYTVIDGVKYPLKENSIIIAKPNQERYSKLHFCCKYFHIELEKGELKDFFDNAKTFFSLSNPKDYEEIFNQIALLSVAFEKNYYKIKSLLYSLVDKLSKEVFHGENSKKSQSVKNAIIKASKFIEENFSEDITLKDIANHVYLHPNYFLKIFKKYYGVSPNEYLNEIRIERAKYMLMATEKSVSEIALTCGFGSQTYFSSVFKKQTGSTPSQFIKYYKKNF